MLRSVRGAGLAAAALVLMSMDAAAQSPTAGLGGLLRLLPQTAAVYQAPLLFSYVDFRAAESAAGAASPESEAAFDGLPEADRDQWVQAMRRLVDTPQWVSAYVAARQPGPSAMAKAVGFDLFAVDRTLSFGSPPDTVTVVAGGTDLADEDRLRNALEPRGFAREMAGDVPVWHRFDDNSINFADIEPADPFGGQLGRAARIAVLLDALVNAANWPVLRAALAARAGEPPAGAMALALKASLASVDELGGADARLIQALALPLASTAGGAPLPEAVLDAKDPQQLFAALQSAQGAAPAGGDGLPPYPLALIADLQIGSDQVAVLALPFADAATARHAAEVLAARLRSWSPPGPQSGGPLVAAVGGTVEAAGTTAGGIAVARVAVRCPLPPPGPDVRHAGIVPRVWLEALYRRQFAPLSLGPAP